MGGKAREYKYIKPLVDLTGVNKIVEPFCGSAAISYAYFKDGFNGDFYLNDNDRELINFYNDIQQNGSDKYIKHARDIMDNDFTKAKHDNIIKEYKKTPTLDGFYYYNKCYNFRKGVYPDPALCKTNVTPGMYDEIDKFYKSPRVHYSCKDYMNTFEQFKDDEKALLFLDPPYFKSCNSTYSEFDGSNVTDDGIYIDKTQMYIDIRTLLKTAECRVIMIINSNALLNDLYCGFIGSEYGKMYNSTQIKTKSKGGQKHKTTHMIVTNMTA